ncbi:MAG: addiction module protein [bacterium]
MTPNETRLLAELLRLPPEARAAFAGTLLDSLEEPPDPSAEAIWQAEIAARARELDLGSVPAVPWSEARRRIAGD